MRTVIIQEIDGYNVVTGFDYPVIDPIATTEALQKALQNVEGKSKAEIEQIISDNIVFFEPRKGEFIIEDEIAITLIAVFEGLKKGFRLLQTGALISDQRGLMYWIKKDGIWSKRRVEKLGEVIPENSILETDLNPTTKTEIANQIKKDCIKCMSKQERYNAKSEETNELLHAATSMRSSFEIQGETPETALMLSKEWYTLRLYAIERMYDV